MVIIFKILLIFIFKDFVLVEGDRVRLSAARWPTPSWDISSSKSDPAGSMPSQLVRQALWTNTIFITDFTSVTVNEPTTVTLDLGSSVSMACVPAGFLACPA